MILYEADYKTASVVGPVAEIAEAADVAAAAEKEDEKEVGFIPTHQYQKESWTGLNSPSLPFP